MAPQDLQTLREERIARNNAMLEQVVGAAKDAVGSEEAMQEAERAAAEQKRAERVQRIVEEAQLAGPRKSARASTVATRERISAAFRAGVPSMQAQLRTHASVECRSCAT